MRRKLRMQEGGNAECVPPSFLLVVTLQEIPSGSIYKTSSKDRAKLSLVLGHFERCDNEYFDDDFYIKAQDGCRTC